MVTTMNEGTPLTTPTMADRLAHYAQQCRVLDDICDSFTRDMDSYRRGNDYVSLFKYPDGTPILPPVMTYAKREEMKMWRQRAVLAETRLKNRHLANKSGVAGDETDVNQRPFEDPLRVDNDGGAVPSVGETRREEVRNEDLLSTPSEATEKKDDSPETFQKDFEEIQPRGDVAPAPSSVAQLTVCPLGPMPSSVDTLTLNMNDLPLKMASSTSSSISNKTVIEVVSDHNSVQNEEIVSVARPATQSAAQPATLSVHPVSRQPLPSDEILNSSAERSRNLLDDVDFDEDIALDLSKEGVFQTKERFSRKIAFMSNQSSTDLESLLGEYQSLPSVKADISGNLEDSKKPLGDKPVLQTNDPPATEESNLDASPYSPQRPASKPKLSVSEEFSHEIVSTYDSSSVDLKQFMCASYVLESSSCGILLDDATEACTTLMDEEFPGSDFEEASLPDLPAENEARDEEVKGLGGGDMGMEKDAKEEMVVIPTTTASDACKSGNASLIRTNSFVISSANTQGSVITAEEFFEDDCVLPEKPLSFVNCSPQRQAFQRDKVDFRDGGFSTHRPKLQLALQTQYSDEKSVVDSDAAEPVFCEQNTSLSPISPSKPGPLRRRNSYDLLTPSPALLKAQVEKDRVFYEAAATAVVQPPPIPSDRSPSAVASHRERPDVCPTPSTMRKLVFQSQPDFTSDCLVPPSAMADVVVEDTTSRPVLLQPGFNNADVDADLERESSFEHIQSHLISQQRDQLAALLAKQEKEEAKLKQRSVVGRLFGGALPGKEKAPAGGDKSERDRPFDRSTSDGSLDLQSVVELKGNGAKFLKLVDGGVEYSDFSSPETSQPKGSAQDLTWDEMADFGQLEESPSTLSLVGFAGAASASTHSRLSALIKGHLTRKLLAVDSIKELRFSFAQLMKLKAMFDRGSVFDEDLLAKTEEQIRSIRADIHDVFFQFPLERRLSLIRGNPGSLSERMKSDRMKTTERVMSNNNASGKKRVKDFAEESSKMDSKDNGEGKSSASKSLTKKRATPQSTPSGVRRALGFSAVPEKETKSRRSSTPKTVTSPKAKPWK